MAHEDARPVQPIPADTPLVPMREWVRLFQGSVGVGLLVPLAVFVVYIGNRASVISQERTPMTLDTVVALLSTTAILQTMVTVGAFVAFGLVLLSARILRARDGSPPPR